MPVSSKNPAAPSIGNPAGGRAVGFAASSAPPGVAVSAGVAVRVGVEVPADVIEHHLPTSTHIFCPSVTIETQSRCARSSQVLAGAIVAGLFPENTTAVTGNCDQLAAG